MDQYGSRKARGAWSSRVTAHPDSLRPGCFPRNFTDRIIRPGVLLQHHPLLQWSRAIL